MPDRHSTPPGDAWSNGLAGALKLPSLQCADPVLVDLSDHRTPGLCLSRRTIPPIREVTQNGQKNAMVDSSFSPNFVRTTSSKPPPWISSRDRFRQQTSVIPTIQPVRKPRRLRSPATHYLNNPFYPINHLNRNQRLSLNRNPFPANEQGKILLTFHGPVGVAGAALDSSESGPLSEGPACQVRLSEGRAGRVHFRRDPLVGSGAQRWIIYPSSTGMTSMPLQPSEGPACRVRCTTLDHLSRFRGHDRRAPPRRAR